MVKLGEFDTPSIPREYAAHSVPHPPMPKVLLQEYDEDTFPTYASLSDALGVSR